MSFSGSLIRQTCAGRRGTIEPTLTFEGGHLHVLAPSLVTHLGTAICIVQGAPRFADPMLAATAHREGLGAAWSEAFATFGSGAPAQARGRFAVVLIQPAQRRVYVATDRFGTWPLCLADDKDALHFASRANDVPLPGKRIALQALFDYLYYHCIPAPRTIYEGVQRLPAGHSAEWHDGQLRLQRYWEPRFDEIRRPALESSKREFLEILTRSVAHEAGNGQVGAFLSGGTDSSTVSGLLGRVLGRPADTYSIGFDAAGYDEMAYARIASRHFGTRHHEYYVTPDDLLQGIPKVAAYYDQPFGNSSAVPAWICADRARQDGQTKLLAGDGGDELFGGNTRYAKQRVFGLYGQVPAWLRGGVLEPVFALHGAKRLPVLKKGASYIEQASVPMPDRMQMYNLLWRLGPQQVLEPGFLTRIDQEEPTQAQRGVWQQAQATTLINRMLAFDWKYTLADNDLPKVVGTTQLAGVDVGFPLLSDELVDFSLGIPPDWKVKGLQLRWFFKEALRGVLPDEIISKKKHGFGLPFGVWTCDHLPLNALARDALETLAGRGVVQPAFIRTLLDTHLAAHPGYYGELVWILMMLEFWLRQHEPEWRLAA
jgi:asparagine synthase (glutamine-hydrolysing)